MLSSSQVRTLWHEFRIQKQHNHLNPASLIADKNSTALFTVAGMQPLIPYLTGQAHPLWTKLYNIQPCIRTNDLEEVGDDSHHTMFFMMGNWSLGAYFKPESVARSREFLTQYLKLDPRKLAVTVYQWDENVNADDETANLWKQQGIWTEKISYLTADDNRRSPGPVWPCGPCTEIYYWIGETEFPWPNDNVKSDDSKRLEIWNNVFMEYYRDDTGKLSKLDKQNVDTGMWFERICKVLQWVQSPYETDLFHSLIKEIEDITHTSYHNHTKHMRVIADHMRSTVFLISEWLLPSNEGRGYVLRRIIRRMYFHLYELFGDTQSQDIIRSCKLLIDDVISTYWSWIEHLQDKNTTIFTTLEKELTQFAKTLTQWYKILDKYIAELWWKNILWWAEVFMLYDTFGFPIELTEEISAKQWIIINHEWFTKTMEQAKEKSRQNTAKINTKDIDRSLHITDLPPTQFIWYDHYSLSDIHLLKTIEFEGYKVVIFDRTPCYATMGGQLHDIGIRTDENSQNYSIFDVQNYNGVFLHFVRS